MYAKSTRPSAKREVQKELASHVSLVFTPIFSNQINNVKTIISFILKMLKCDSL